MPYVDRRGRMERSRSTGHVPIVENELVKQRLREYRVSAEEPGRDIDASLLVTAESLGEPGEPVKWVMAFDGSPQEVAVREEYPSSRIGYVQVAGVLVHLDELLGQRDAHLVDPSVVHQATHQALHSIVLPGSNVCRRDMATVRDSWRAEVYEIFRDHRVEDASLLEILMLLIGHSDKRSSTGGVVIARCPSRREYPSPIDCPAVDIDVSDAGGTCPSCGCPVYPTDALRIHEEVSEEHSNATSLGRLMTVIEHITMVGYLHFLLRRRPGILGSVGLILDGPLALFGPQAWLHAAMMAFLNDMRNALRNQAMRWPVIVGIEKGGQFAEHGAAIAERIPRGCLMQLPDDYIYRHVLTFRPSPNSFFGRDTYYGQKFFYTTAQGHLLTISVPKPQGSLTEPHLADHYPGLPDTLTLLDRIGTTLYEDAVIPVALAHSFAAIPLRTGSKVLVLLSRELLGLS